MARNPVDGFQVDPASIKTIGRALQRPECILAERDGSLWAADARGGVVHISPDGSQRIISQTSAGAFADATRFTQGTLPNGLAFACNGDILISNFGTDRLEVMRRTGETKSLYDRIDGKAIGKVNFVLRDSRHRIWLTVSTRSRTGCRLSARISGTASWRWPTKRGCVSLPTAFISPMRSGSTRGKNGSKSSKPAACG